MTEVRLFRLDGALPHAPAVEAWFQQRPGPLRAQAQRWFSAMRACGPDVEVLLHDGQPTACVSGIALGYVDVFAHHLNVGFYLGATLPDPAGLLTGSGRFMRHVKVGPGGHPDEAALGALIRAAYADLRFRLDASSPTPRGTASA